MKKRKSGCILFISSLASILGMHDIQAYTLCKSGVKGLTRSLSRDLGPYGIRVNSLNPGFVYTDMLAKTNLKTPERLEEIQNRTPLRGFAKEKRPWNGKLLSFALMPHDSLVESTLL